MPLPFTVIAVPPEQLMRPEIPGGAMIEIDCAIERPQP